jgi:hypothetical protein
MIIFESRVHSLGKNLARMIVKTRSASNNVSDDQATSSSTMEPSIAIVVAIFKEVASRLAM